MYNNIISRILENLYRKNVSASCPYIHKNGVHRYSELQTWSETLLHHYYTNNATSLSIREIILIITLDHSTDQDNTV